MALPPRREQGPIVMVHPRTLLDPIGFQEAMRGVTADLAGAPVKALVDGWSATGARAVDTIAPKRPLRHRDRPAPWFNQDLWALKQVRRWLERKWRKDPTDCNSIAVKVTTNLYLAKVKAVSRVYLANRISEASNQQAELFCIVRDLTGTCLSDGPPPSFSPDQFAAF